MSLIIGAPEPTEPRKPTPEDFPRLLGAAIKQAIERAWAVRYNSYIVHDKDTDHTIVVNDSEYRAYYDADTFIAYLETIFGEPDPEGIVQIRDQFVETVLREVETREEHFRADMTAVMTGGFKGLPRMA